MGAGVGGVVNLILSGNLITLTNTLLSRCRNFTSMGVNENTVIVNLTTIVVNRIILNGVFGGFTLELFTYIINNVVCCVIVAVILHLNLGTGSLGLFSTLIITVFLNIPC